jgi:hypothetical protein
VVLIGRRFFFHNKLRLAKDRRHYVIFAYAFLSILPVHTKVFFLVMRTAKRQALLGALSSTPLSAYCTDIDVPMSRRVLFPPFYCICILRVVRIVFWELSS